MHGRVWCFHVGGSGPEDRRTRGGGGWGITFSWSNSCCRLALYCGVLV